MKQKSVFTKDSLNAMGLQEQADGTWKRPPNPTVGWDVTKDVSPDLGKAHMSIESFKKTKKLKVEPVHEHNIKDIYRENPFFISGVVRSGKNNKRIGSRFFTKNGIRKRVPALHLSEAATRYVEESSYQWEKLAPLFRLRLEGLKKPYRIEFHFVMDHEFHWDYHNMTQLPADLMVKHGWLEDDDKKTMIPMYKEYSIDKENPGLYITILNDYGKEEKR